MSRSVRARPSASSIVRTEWPSFTPVSQIGYHSRSATSLIATFRRCSNITSMSLPGASSARPYPPTATSAMPSPAPAAS